MNKSPAEIPIMVLVGIKSPFPIFPFFFFFFASSLCPFFVPPPLVPPAIDGQARFTARGHAVVLISLSRLGGISTSFAETHHQVPQLCLTKQREENADGQPISLSACLCPFFCLCLRWCRNFPSAATQERNTSILENLWTNFPSRTIWWYNL